MRRFREVRRGPSSMCTPLASSDLPIFQSLGRTITLLGPLGSGGFTKLANQIIVAVNLTALAEALTLAKKAGLDRERTLKALAGGLAGSKCLEQKTSNYLAGSY